MPLLLLAITTSEPVVSAPMGLRGRPCACFDQDGLTVWASAFSDEAPVDGLRRADLLEHHELVSRLHGERDACLPARFPTWVADEEVLRADLSRRCEKLATALERVRGRCELAVSMTWTAPEQEPLPAPPVLQAGTPGLQYLRERQRAVSRSDERRERARALARGTEQLVGSELVEVRHQVCPSPLVALSSALLVPRRSADEIKARLARTQLDVRILVNGPWPAYSFAAVD